MTTLNVTSHISILNLTDLGSFYVDGCVGTLDDGTSSAYKNQLDRDNIPMERRTVLQGPQAGGLQDTELFLQGGLFCSEIRLNIIRVESGVLDLFTETPFLPP